MTSTPHRFPRHARLSRTQHRRGRILHGRDCFVFRRDPGYRRCRRQLYGGGVTTGRFGFAPLVELAADLRCPWLGLYGDLDQSIPVDQVEALREATNAAPVPTEIVRYPRASTVPLRRATRFVQRGRRDRRPRPRTRLLRRAPQRQIVNCAERPSRRRPCRCVVLPVARGPVRQ